MPLVFVFFFFFPPTCNANRKLEMGWPRGKDKDKIAINIYRGDARGGNEKTPQAPSYHHVNVPCMSWYPVRWRKPLSH